MQHQFTGRQRCLANKPTLGVNNLRCLKLSAASLTAQVFIKQETKLPLREHTSVANYTQG